MSYEGYTQILCEKGHYDSQDAYSGYDRKIWKCTVCGSKTAWENMVDTTNGSYEGKKRIDGHITLKFKNPPVMCICDKCGDKHVKEQATYKIPKKGRKS